MSPKFSEIHRILSCIEVLGLVLHISIYQRIHNMIVVQLVLLPVLLMLMVSSPAKAHEYWLDPVGTRWSVGDVLAVDIRNGDDLVGASFPFDPTGLQRGGLISSSQRRVLSGRLGDYPAIQLQLDEPGLHLVMLETTRRKLIYEDLAAFEEFLNYHSFTDVLARHQQRGLSESNIVEYYYRYCKTLVFVEDDALQARSQPIKSSDKKAEFTTIESDANTPALKAQAQRLELIVGNNPIGEATLRLQLQFEGKPLALRQIEIFHRSAEQHIVRHTAMTDATGHVAYDVSAKGDYLINSVQLLEPDSGSDADWITLWSSLFFQQPGQ